MDGKRLRSAIDRIERLTERRLRSDDSERNAIIEELKSLIGDEDLFTDEMLHKFSDDLLFGRINLGQARIMDLKTPGLWAMVRADGFIEFFLKREGKVDLILSDMPLTVAEARAIVNEKRYLAKN